MSHASQIGHHSQPFRHICSMPLYFIEIKASGASKC
jgi:hypothetical protein